MMPRRAALVSVVTVALVLAAGIGVDRALRSDRAATCSPARVSSSRPELDRVLDGVVAQSIAPGATAYVIGPHGRWSGAAGLADADRCVAMTVDARMRLESVSKIYTAALVVQLAQERRLRVGDTVATWAPGLLPYGRRITIRQLLTMRSGLIDNNDFVNSSDAEKHASVARIVDPSLRGEIAATAARVADDPAAVFPETLWIRWAAAQPLLYAPGSTYHYSNIGYEILGLIAARAAATTLPTLYADRIVRPLGLRATSYDPQGPIHGPHAHGYAIQPSGTRSDATAWHSGVGAEGGVVSNAPETARFLRALMSGHVVNRAGLSRMKGDDLWLGGAPSGCAGRAYGWSGGGSGFKSEVWANGDGTRVAVLLLNGRHMGAAQPAADQAAHDALASLYCNA